MTNNNNDKNGFSTNFLFTKLHSISFPVNFDSEIDPFEKRQRNLNSSQKKYPAKPALK